MRALILAAGKGERMRPLTLIKPKPLLEVCGTSLIEHHILNLKNAGIREIIVNVSWLAQQIMQKLQDGSKYGVNIKYSYEGDEPLETGGGILKALPLLGELPFLVVNADIKTDFDFSTLKPVENVLAHLVLVDNPEHNPKGDFSIAENHLLAHAGLEEIKYTYSGIGIYHPNLFSECKHGKFSVVPLLKDAMTASKVSGELFNGNWDDIGNIDRLMKINKDCKSTKN